ncbi:MAG: hypothetical protein ACOX1I_01305 [Dethiobacteria bacterium]
MICTGEVPGARDDITAIQLAVVIVCENAGPFGNALCPDIFGRSHVLKKMPDCLEIFAPVSV